MHLGGTEKSCRCIIHAYRVLVCHRMLSLEYAHSVGSRAGIDVWRKGVKSGEQGVAAVPGQC